MKFVINDTISQETVNKMLESILMGRNSIKDDTIYLYINSPGGDVDAGYAIYEMLRLSGKHVITYAVSHVFSCAVLVYLAGDYRFAHNYSQFMIHEPYHELMDDKMTIQTYKEHIEDLDKCIDGFFKIICQRTKLNMEKIKTAIQKSPDGDWYIKADQAKKLGIIHDIGLPY